MIALMLQILTLEFFLIKLVIGTNDCSKCTPNKSSKTCSCTKFIPNCVYHDEECLYCEGYLFSQKKYFKIEKSGQSSTCQVITSKDMIQNFKFVYILPYPPMLKKKMGNMYAKNIFIRKQEKIYLILFTVCLMCVIPNSNIIMLIQMNV